MRIGVLGLGRLGAFHAQTLADLPAVESLVVYDLVPAVAAALAERVGAEAVDSPAAVVTAGVDALVIATNTSAHPELLLAAAEAGLPVFCEKPVAGDVRTGQEVLRRVQATGAPVQIGYQRRFDAGFRAAREAVRSGQLGWLHTVRSTTLDPAPPSPDYVATSGGLFRDCGVHDFDIVRWITGAEVVEVYATGSNRGDAFFGEVGDVDTSAAVLTLDDGTLGLVSNGRYNLRGYDVRLEVHGSADSVAVGLDHGLPLRSVEPGVTFPAGPPHAGFLARFAGAYRAELVAFAGVVAGEQESECSLADALEAEWVAEACLRSWREHRPVGIAEVKQSG